MLSIDQAGARGVAAGETWPAGGGVSSPTLGNDLVDNDNAAALHSAVMPDRADRVLINFRIDRDLMAGLKFVAVRDGVPQSEQVRRAIRAWLESRQAIKAASRRAETRRKA